LELIQQLELQGHVDIADYWSKHILFSQHQILRNGRQHSVLIALMRDAWAVLMLLVHILGILEDGQAEVHMSNE
jgi:hypothetical protein